MRYQTTHERSYQRHAVELRKLQSDRRTLESGFVSQKHREADQQRKQEKHEISTAYTKSHTDYQLMKSRLLLPKMIQAEEFEEERQQDRKKRLAWEKIRTQRWRQEEQKRRESKKIKQKISLLAWNRCFNGRRIVGVRTSTKLAIGGLLRARAAPIIEA